MQFKLGLQIIFGAGVIAAVATVQPQTPESAKSYLESHGYSRVRVEGPKKSCGKHKKIYTFAALTSAGRDVSGELCMDVIPMFNSVHEDS